MSGQREMCMTLLPICSLLHWPLLTRVEPGAQMKTQNEKVYKGEGGRTQT